MKTLIALMFLSSIRTPNIKDNCGCYHDKSKEIRQSLEQFMTYMETKSLLKVGDRVEISEPRPINSIDAPGWMCHRHVLIEGAKGIVVETEYYGNEFGYLVQFDNDNSWIDEEDVIHPNSDPNERHNFFFKEHNLRKAGASITCDF